MEGVLTETQARVAKAVLDQEGAARHHLVVALSGAHAYVFPSPDSDLDLKGIHVDPTSNLVGLAPKESHANRMEVSDGVEIDYSSNEIQPALLGILQGNGNYIERVVGRLILRSSPEHETLRPLVMASLSRRAHRHYRGFSAGMLRELAAAAAPTAKKLLYVLRTALTGAHLLASGEVVTDVGLLIDEYGFAAARTLIELKRAGERVVLTDAQRSHWTAEVQRAFSALDAARDRSALPEEAPNRADLEAWLIALRRDHFPVASC